MTHHHRWFPTSYLDDRPVGWVCRNCLLVTTLKGVYGLLCNER